MPRMARATAPAPKAKQPARWSRRAVMTPDQSSSRTDATGETTPPTLGERIGIAVMLSLFVMTGVMGVLTIIAGVRQLLSGAAPLAIALLLIVIGIAFAALGFGY